MTEPLLLSASDPESITRAVAALRAGQVVAFPTDTVYGLGAHSGLAEAIEQLYQIKGREHQKAIPLLLARTEDVSAVARDVPDLAWRLAARFWPGPVTLVLLGAATLLDVLTAGAPTVAVRVPAHPLALRLISALGVPLATTSANLSGQPEAVTAQEVWAALGARVALVLDGGRCPGGVASTLVDVTTAPPTIRRRGALVAEVEAFLS
jgi:L-threonylcarbamoyladenylate synthase